MHVCELNLGAAPWAALSEGRVRGQMAWDGEGPFPVSVIIRGAHSRKFPRRSLQVTLKGTPLQFGSPESHTVGRLHLNADYVDPTRLRSRLSFALFEAVGAPAPVARHVGLSLSGEFSGIYVALESVDADFLRRRGWASGPIFYAINRNANFGLISPSTQVIKDPLEIGYQCQNGADPTMLRQMLTAVNLASERGFPRVAERWIDVPGYLRWLMVAVFVGNRDGFVHNYALYYDPEAGHFRIIPWDYDATFGIDVNGRPARLDRVPLLGWNKLSHRLLAVQRFRQAYREMFVTALKGPLAPPWIHQEIDKMCQEISPWIDRDQQLQGFEAGVMALRQWVEDRRHLLAGLLEVL